jgi:hypothetical protein
LLVASPKLGQHILRGDPLFIIVLQTLVFCDVADGAKGSAANLEPSICDIVGHGENLLGLLVQEQVVITKVAPLHVPVEILCLYIECEHVGQQMAQCARNLGDSLVAKTSGSSYGALIHNIPPN